MDFCHLSHKYEKNLLDNATKTGLQSWTKYLARSKEIQENWTNFKSLLSNFVCFLTAIVKVQFVEGRLDTTL